MIKKKTIFLIFKIFVSISLLTYIILKIDWNEAFNNLEGANYYLLVMAFSLNIVERLILTYKWNQLIRIRGIDISFFRLFSINLIGGFWGLFLPSSLGTDVVRGYYLVKNNGEKSVSVSSIFVDRILGLFSLLLCSVVAVIIGGDLISKVDIKFYVLALFAVGIFSFYLFQKEGTARILEKILKKIKHHKLAELFIKLHTSILEYKKHPGTLLSSFFLTVLAHATHVLIFYIVALAFNISVPLIYFFLFIPIITLIIMIPISIGGLGVGEGVFITFFSLVGISMSDCVVMAFTNSIINILFTLSGGIVFLFFKNLSKQEILPSKQELKKPDLEPTELLKD